jgi:SWIM zinc finger
MSYWGGGYPPYVSVAERRAKAEKAIAKATKAGKNFAPITAYRGAVAKSFWGKAWCDNLLAYSDYANRLPRGATYVRNGSVIDLQVNAGEVQARVMGSSLYTVEVNVQPVLAPKWQAICTDCASSIDTLVELLQGKLAKPVMERICTPKTGLFPAPNEIQFSCSCPDSAGMCKHIAAVLYGIGARLIVCAAQGQRQRPGSPSRQRPVHHPQTRHLRQGAGRRGAGRCVWFGDGCHSGRSYFGEEAQGST